jgi:hypothetical protein
MGQQGLSELHVRMLRGWQLAILRFAVTLDNADRLGVLAVANEVDRLGRQHGQAPNFDFFRRSSVELCAAILQRNEAADTTLRQYLSHIDDGRLKRAFAASLAIDEPEPISVKRHARADHDLWRGLPSRGPVAQD